jgi:hydrogenase nickel incorporation protein HypA/HybF
MHELSIAVSIVEVANEEALKRNATRVTELHLKVGPLSGVVKDALLFSYDIAASGTLLEGSRLVIEDVPVVIHCTKCDAERTLDSIQLFACPVCGALTPEVIHGRELEVVAMELEENFEEVIV